MSHMTAFNPVVIEELQRSIGVLAGERAGVPVRLLTTTGRQAGVGHTTPLEVPVVALIPGDPRA